MSRRNYIFDTIRKAFHLFGFQQIETPAMENLSTLMGKYGEEGDKLLFKIQNSGDYFKGLTDEELLGRNAAKLASKFCEKGLRYDLTVPFARYVVMHRDELSFPFKRYQIQPVWRADRPQKGRYREFYQCDADIIGNNSLINEVELIQLIDYVFEKLNIRVAIKLNNRKVLAGIADVIGEPEKIIDITVAIDKIDKIGRDGVIAELKSKEISDESIEKLLPILKAQGDNEEKMQILAETLKGNETGEKGVCIVTIDTDVKVQAKGLHLPRFFDLKTEVTEDAVQAVEAVLPAVAGNDFYRITLTGNCEVDLDALQQAFGSYPNLTFRDRTEEPMEIWGNADTDSLEGIYFGMLRKALEESPENARQIQLAAEISRKILSGREVKL